MLNWSCLRLADKIEKRGMGIGHGSSGNGPEPWLGTSTSTQWYCNMAIFKIDRWYRLYTRLLYSKDKSRSPRKEWTGFWPGEQKFFKRFGVEERGYLYPVPIVDAMFLRREFIQLAVQWGVDKLVTWRSRGWISGVLGWICRVDDLVFVVQETDNLYRSMRVCLWDLKFNAWHLCILQWNRQMTVSAVRQTARWVAWKCSSTGNSISILMLNGRNILVWSKYGQII